MVVAVTYYGMSTFEGPMMSIKSVNAVSHFTDWTIGHVHAGALGWNAFLSFGILYYAIPAPLEDDALFHEAGDAALLARHDRPHRLPGVDVGRRHHAVGDVARLRAGRSSRLSGLHRDRASPGADVRSASALADSCSSSRCSSVASTS